MENIMGLDMYLHAKKYVGGGYSFTKEDAQSGHEEAIKAVEAFEHLTQAVGFDPSRYEHANFGYVEVQVAYWRKANAIHGWFVRNVQGGEDECKPHEVSREQLNDLRELCQEILRGVDKGEGVEQTSMFGQTYMSYPNVTFSEEARATIREELPPTAGFFFGGTDVDEWYVEGLEETVKMLDVILSDPALEDADFVYQSSW